jgi:hypothetical protein
LEIFQSKKSSSFFSKPIPVQFSNKTWACTRAFFLTPTSDAAASGNWWQLVQGASAAMELGSGWLESAWNVA